MNFHEVRFPTAISFHSSGGPERKTEIVALGSGFEERNAVWANSRRRYNAGYGVRSLDDLHAAIAFFEARLGRLYGFRFKDWTDFKSCPPGASISPSDQPVGTGDGTTTQFQLCKIYASGPASWTRVIKKPVDGSVRVLVAGSRADGRLRCRRDDGSCDLRRPARKRCCHRGGFQFDTPVRFDNDSLSVNLSNFTAGEIPSIPLVEVFI